MSSSIKKSSKYFFPKLKKKKTNFLARIICIIKIQSLVWGLQSIPQTFVTEKKSEMFGLQSIRSKLAKLFYSFNKCTKGSGGGGTPDVLALSKSPDTVHGINGGHSITHFLVYIFKLFVSKYISWALKISSTDCNFLK